MHLYRPSLQHRFGVHALPDLARSLTRLASRITEGSENFSRSSVAHCFRSDLIYNRRELAAAISFDVMREGFWKERRDHLVFVQTFHR